MENSICFLDVEFKVLLTVFESNKKYEGIIKNFLESKFQKISFNSIQLIDNDLQFDFNILELDLEHKILTTLYNINNEIKTKFNLKNQFTSEDLSSKIFIYTKYNTYDLSSNQDLYLFIDRLQKQYPIFIDNIININLVKQNLILKITKNLYLSLLSKFNDEKYIEEFNHKNDKKINFIKNKYNELLNNEPLLIFNYKKKNIFLKNL